MIVIARCSSITKWTRGHTKALAGHGLDLQHLFESKQRVGEWLVLGRPVEGYSTAGQENALREKELPWMDVAAHYVATHGCSEADAESFIDGLAFRSISVFEASVPSVHERAWRHWYTKHFKAVVTFKAYHAGLCLELDQSNDSSSSTLDFMTMYQLAGDASLNKLSADERDIDAEREHERWEREGRPMTSAVCIERFTHRISC